jgi:hypothetical protein
VLPTQASHDIEFEALIEPLRQFVIARGVGKQGEARLSRA